MDSGKNYNSSVTGNNFSKRQNYWIAGFGILAILFVAIHFLLELKLFGFWEEYIPLLKKLSLSLFFISLVILIGKLIEKVIATQSRSEGHRYNLIRITRMATTILVLIVAIAFFSQQFYFAAISFGLISLVLGFALQAPITSFIGWLYIVFRSPYKVGDRIQIGKFKGDVVEIDYLDTTLLEVGGDYLVNDRLSGRMIYLPNSTVLRSEVFNYSGPAIPFIWNETAIQIAYNSEVDFVHQCLLDASTRDFETRYPDHSLEQYPQWKPDVYFRVNTYAWLEAVVSYPVKPTDTTPRRTEILKLALQKMNAQPGRVMLPEGRER